MSEIIKSEIISGLWNPEQLQLIKSVIAPGCSDPELLLFAQVCKRTALDPFAKQIYAIPRGYGDKRKLTIQVSIDGLRLIADRTGKYDGSETVWCGMDGVWRDVWLFDEPPAAAKTTIYRLGSDRPFTGIARWGSYAQFFKGNLGDMWAKFPDLMLGKCSEALALRKAFPHDLAGLYCNEEMGQAGQADDNPSFSSAQATQSEKRRGATRLTRWLEWTGIPVEDAKKILINWNGKSSTHELSDSEFDGLRDQLFAHWGLQQGVFNALRHALNSLAQITAETQDDTEIWDRWVQKISEKIQPADQEEFIPVAAEVA